MALHSLIENIERAAADFTILLLHMREHQSVMAKERTAFRAIHERLTQLREPLPGWERAAT